MPTDRTITEIAAIFATGIIRLIRARAEWQKQAKLGTSDSSRLELLSAAPQVMYQERDTPVTHSMERDKP